MRPLLLLLLLTAGAAVPRTGVLLALPVAADYVDLSMGGAVEKIKAANPTGRVSYGQFLANRIRVYPLTEDEKTYDELAVNALAGKGFSMDRGWYIVPPGKPTSYWNCLYPLFLTVTYKAFGHNLLPVFFAQILAGSLSCAAVYFLGARYFGATAGWVAYGAACLYPPYVLNSLWMMTEALCVPLVIFGLLFFARAMDDRRVRSFALSGAFFGAAAITRSTVFYFIPVLAVGALLFANERNSLITRVPVFLAAAVLVIAPWTYRNWRVHHAFVPVDTKSGVALWMYNNPAQELGFGLQDNDMPLLDFEPGTTEVEMDGAYFECWREYVSAHKTRFVKAVAIKAVLALNPVPKQLNSGAGKMVGLLAAVWFLVLAPVGIAVTRKRWKELFPLYLLITYWLLVQAVSAAGMRYRLPAEVAWILFAAAGAVWFLGTLKRARPYAHERPVPRPRSHERR